MAEKAVRISLKDLAEGNGAEHAMTALSPAIFLRSRVTEK